MGFVGFVINLKTFKMNIIKKYRERLDSLKELRSHIADSNTDEENRNLDKEIRMLAGFVSDMNRALPNPELKNSERNLQVIENFILHLTHCGDENETLFTFRPKELYQAARDYIEEDHVDGKENPED